MPYQFSDALDDELLYERCESFGGGMDAFSTPSLLPPDVWQYGENVVVPDNLRVRTRPGADTLGAAPNGGKVIQGLVYFDTPNYKQLIAGAGTRLFAWAGAAWAEMLGYVLSDEDLQFAAAQGVDKLLITDGVQNMRSWDGAAFTDLGNQANTITSDPPVGATILCWHAGRMFASGVAARNDTVWASKLLNFGTGGWDHTNFSFRVGGGEGDAVQCMIPLPPAGPNDYRMAVIKANNIYTVNADPTTASAADWQIQRVQRGIGGVGRWCAAPSGNDVLFMAKDGVRKVRRMENAAGQYELSPPISTPMQPFIDRINWSYAHLIAAVSYKHLTLFAVPLDSSTTNNTVLVFNGRLQRWTGIWTAWSPASWEVTRFGGVLRLVLGEQTGLVRQFKDYADQADDATYLDDGVYISSRLWTRAMLFGEPVNDKDGYHMETRFNAGSGQVNVTAVADGADVRTANKDLTATGVNLPVDLPFDLPSPTAQRPLRRGLRGLRPFNEIYLKIESAPPAGADPEVDLPVDLPFDLPDPASGSSWFELKNVTLSAFLNMLQNQ